MTETDKKRGSRAATRSSGQSTVPRAARVTAAIALAVAAMHILLTAVFNLPYPALKYDVLPGRTADAYLRPYFVQDYRIFAPDPVNSDRNLWVRAWVETPDGERVESPWVDATSVEIAAPYRRILRKQMTVLGAERLNTAHRGLTAAQQKLAEGNYHRGGDLTPLLEALKDVDDSNVAAVNQYIRVSNFITSYSTQVAYAMWGDEGKILAVQFRSVSSPVVRWEDRSDPDAERPKSSYTPIGWRPPMEWSAQDRDGFARSFVAWAEKAGVSVDLDGGGEAPGDQRKNADEGDDGGAGGEE